MIPFKAPSFNLKAFNCPHCNAFAEQYWSMVKFVLDGSLHGFDQLKRTQCVHCDRYTLWHNERMIFPQEGNVPEPNIDLGDDIKEDYREAKAIVSSSPRGACALLRLAIQKLCKQLGKDGKNINEDIAELVDDGLSKKVQQALDIVRVVGNNAVHPGQLDLKDDPETATQMFSLINLIAEVLISQPKQVDAMYIKLPEKSREAIESRDNTVVK